VPDPDGADAGAGVDEGKLNMRRKPTMKITTPAIALTPWCVLSSKKMKMAPIIIRTIETIGAPKTPRPRSARAMAVAPTTVKMMVGWYRSASIAKTPAKNSMLSRFGSLMTERNIDLVPA